MSSKDAQLRSPLSGPSHGGDQPVAAQDEGRSRDRVFNAIRQRLINGTYRPGEKIKLRPLAAALGTSITPVREGLLQLVVAGSLVHDRQHSVRVPDPDVERYRELRHLRLFLEGDIAAAAALAIDEATIERLEQISLDLSVREKFDAAKLKADVVRFHFTLYGAAQRPITYRLIESLWLQTGPYMNYIIADAPLPGLGVKLRGQICRGLRRRDATSVREAIQTDLLTSLDRVIERLEAEGARSAT